MKRLQAKIRTGRKAANKSSGNVNKLNIEE
jgi:hypothetical protein